MEIKRIDSINETEMMAVCRRADIKGSRLYLSAACQEMDKDWKGFAVSYNYKIIEDREIYFIKADNIKREVGDIVISAVVDLNSFPFKSTNWSIYSVYEEAGELFSVRIQYKAVNQSTLKFIFSKDAYVDNKKNIVFCCKTGGAYLGLRYRALSRYDGWLTRLKEAIAYTKFMTHEAQFKSRRVYLIYEKRCQKAQDNGYHLFKYMMDNHIDKYLNVEIYYVIEKDSIDRKKLENYKDNVLDFMSLKFIYALLAANLLISPDSRAHAYIWQYNKSLVATLLPKKNHMFLGHGVLAFKRLNDSFTARSMKSVLCTVTSEKEADIVCNELGFSRDRIATTGYARFDVLHDTSGDSKNILIMPTHRSWVFGIERRVFVESEYYKRYMELINSDEFISMLQKNDAKAYFYVHPSIMEQTDAFTSVSDRIEVVPYGKYSLDDLMMQCRMLITDYSSIAWDMYYMGKPIVFYQYDVDRYMETWGSYVDLTRDMPGDRVADLDSLIEVTEQYIADGFKLKPEFDKVRKDSFAYIDSNNCKRICEELKKRNYF